MARYVLPVVGGIVGFIYGGPAGAQLGFMLGSAAGGAIDPQVIKGPGVGDIAQQTSQEGVPRPIVFGLSQPIAGNIIASGPPRIVKKRKRQGKGGPKVETESVYRTYAIRVSEGTIDAFVRVWRNNQLVYDVRPDTVAAMADNNAKFLKTARFFYGDFTQNASPDLEALFGVGTTPAHRGTAYMVMADEDLTDQRGAIPQYTFQVANGYNIATKTVYAPGVYTFTKTNRLLSVDVQGVGGGGGGSSGGGSPGETRGGGGSGGGFFRFSLDASLLEDETTITVGAGGAGGVPVDARPGGHHGDPGDDGGSTIFEGWAQATGGGGGQPYTGSGAGAATIGFGEILEEDGPTDVTIDNGGIGWKPEIPVHEPGTSTWGGGGGGSWEGQTGGASTHEGEGETGGRGGAAGSTQVDAPGTPGLPGFEYGGGGGGGGCALTSIGPGLIYSGAGGHGADGVLAVTAHYGTIKAVDVVAAICERAGLEPEMYDTSEIGDLDILGLTITNSYPAYTILQSLSQVFFFVPSYYDGVLHFVPGGGNTVATITESDMVDDENSIDETQREDSIAVPRVMHLMYYDVLGGLATDKQTSERAGDRRAIGERTMESAVLMEAPRAAKVVAINHKIAIEQLRGTLKFCLPDSWLELTPADPVFVQANGQTHRCQIIRVETLDGYQEYELQHDRQSSFTSEVEGIPAAPQSTPPSNVIGPTLVQPLDIHIIRDADDNAGLIYYVAVSGTGAAWTGALVELSFDGGQNYVDGVTTTVDSVMGTIEAELPDHPQSIPDQTNTLLVSIVTPEADIEETDLAGLLNRRNLAIVGDELIQFANAEEVTEGHWSLSYLLRGRRGTTTTDHAAGERFVIVDTATLSAIPASVSDIGRTLTFRATSFGETEDTATVVSMVYEGRSQIEREVAYLAARLEGTDAVVEWQGIGRLGSGATVAHGARFTGYRVTFEGFATGETAIEVNTTAQTITQSVATLTQPIRVRVVQVNSLTGEGPAVEVYI